MVKLLVIDHTELKIKLFLIDLICALVTKTLCHVFKNDVIITKKK